MKIGERYSRTVIASAAVLLMCGTGPRAGISGPQASSQSQATTSGPSATAPAANPADVSSIDAILHAAYDTISGPAGRQRDWDRFRSLFVSGARLAAVVPNHQEGFRTVVLSPEEYIQHDDPYFRNHGFFERKWRDAPNASRILRRCSALTNRATPPTRSPSSAGSTASN